MGFSSTNPREKVCLLVAPVWLAKRSSPDAELVGHDLRKRHGQFQSH